MGMEMGRDKDKRTREVAIEELLKISKYPNRLMLLDSCGIHKSHHFR